MFQQQKKHQSTGPYSTGRPGRSGATRTEERSSKVDPSFKSKRYRDKLREQIKSLETLLPIDRTALHRKLDSQTVFRLVISYFRTKIFFQAAGLSPSPSTDDNKGIDGSAVENPSTIPLTLTGGDRYASVARQDVDLCSEMDDTLEGELLLQALDGFLFVLTSDGTILYTSENIATHLGFNQVDLVHRCIYGIVHPDDHHELMVVLEHTLPDPRRPDSQQSVYDVTNSECPDYKKVCFLCRLKCFNGTSTGYVKMQCNGTMRSFPEVVKPSSRTSCQVLFAVCRPFVTMASDANIDVKKNVFGSKHEMDLKIKNVDDRVYDVTGFQAGQLEGKSFYEIAHLHDITTVYAWHKLLVDTCEINTMYFRMMKSDGSWVWLHTRGKVVYKNSRKYSITMTHCPVREEDSSYLKQEAMMRSRYAIEELMKNKLPSESITDADQYLQWSPHCAVLKHKQFIEDGPLSLQTSANICPSSYHQSSDRHSPVFPSTYVYNRYQPRDRSIKSKTFETTAAQQQQFQSLQQQELQQFNVYGYSYGQQFTCRPVEERMFQFSSQQRLTHLPMECYNECTVPVEQPEIKTEPVYSDFDNYPAIPHDQMLTPQTSPDCVYQVQYQTPGMTAQTNHIVYPNTPLSPPPSPVTMTTAHTQCSQVNPARSIHHVQGPDSGFSQFVARDNCRGVMHGNANHRTAVINNTHNSNKHIDNNCHIFMHGNVGMISNNSSQTFTKSCRYASTNSRVSGQAKYCQVAESPSVSQLPPYPIQAANNSNFVGARVASYHSDELFPRASSLPPIGSFLDFLNEEMIVPINSS